MAEIDVLEDLLGPEKPDLEEGEQDAQVPETETVEGEEKETPTPGVETETDKVDKDPPDEAAAAEIVAEAEIPATDDAVEKYKRENKGLLEAKRAEVKKRQDVEAERDDLKTKFTELLENVAKTKQQPELDPEAETVAESLKIVLEVDDDGNPVISDSVLQGPLGKYIQKQTAPLAEQLQAIIKKNEFEDTQKRFTSALEKAIGEVVAERPEDFGPAHKKFMPAWHFVNSRMQKQYTDIDAMMNDIEQNGIADEFRDEFPGVEIGDVAMAFANKYSFRRALSQFVSKDEPQPEVVVEEEKPKTDGKAQVQTLKKLSEKPQTLAGVRSQQAPVRKKNELAHKSLEELLDLDDKAIDAAERELFAE